MTQQPPHPYASRPEEPATGPIRVGPPPTLDGGTGTNTMAILSVVFAVVFSPLGIVFGIVGRRQTKRTGQAGRGLATVGLWLSVVLLVVGLAVAAYAVVLAMRVVAEPPADGVDQPAVTAPVDPATPTGPAPTGPAGTATVGVTAGDYGPEVPADALAAQVAAQSGAEDVVCPGYLPAQLDASTECAGTVDGQQAQLRTTVTAVEGGEATVDITRVG